MDVKSAFLNVKSAFLKRKNDPLRTPYQNQTRPLFKPLNKNFLTDFRAS